ncbi:zinc-binding dehydrogenase [Xylaria nigripes]|nr:zinc-binding dehydrogenase [Xylaria nigripes]
MKAFITIGEGKASVQETDAPKPKEGQILVRVHYAAQNPTDWKSVSFSPAGRIVGCDFAGTIADPNGSSWCEGQRVAGFIYGTQAGGSYAEYLVTDASLVWAVPDSISFRDASTFSLGFATAVQAIFQRLNLPEPSAPATSPVSILINGATGSVGMYAVQLAKLAGLRVIATGSPKNHERLKSFGADEVVDYNDAAWPDKVRELTQDGLQHALDCIAEKGTTEAVAKAISTNGGHVVGLLPCSSENFPKVKIESTIVYTVFGRPIDLTGWGFQNWGGETPRDRELWEKYLRLLPDYVATGKIRPNPNKEMGGLDAVNNGFTMQIEGKVHAEKLVYKITE